MRLIPANVQARKNQMKVSPDVTEVCSEINSGPFSPGPNLHKFRIGDVHSRNFRR